jgi:phosphoribosylformylglycinamidine synthase subunit PurS
MKARIAITLKNGVLDPQGKAIHSALINHGFDAVTNVRQGKIIDLDIQSPSLEKATQDINAMCQKLLANTVIENYEILSIMQS